MFACVLVPFSLKTWRVLFTSINSNSFWLLLRCIKHVIWFNQGLWLKRKTLLIVSTVKIIVKREKKTKKKHPIKIVMAACLYFHWLQRVYLSEWLPAQYSPVKYAAECWLLSPLLFLHTVRSGDVIWQTGSSCMSLCPPTCILMGDYVAL